jgi:hypothetical protein
MGKLAKFLAAAATIIGAIVAIKKNAKLIKNLAHHE